MTTSSRTAHFDDIYGLQVDSASATEVRGRVEVCDRVRQPSGLVHGGVYASIAEALATMGTHEGIGRDQTAVGLANSTNFLRPAHEGTLSATSIIRHRGRTTCVWDVEVRDDEQRLCAVTRMTVAVRPVGPGSGVGELGHGLADRDQLLREAAEHKVTDLGDAWPGAGSCRSVS